MLIDGRTPRNQIKHFGVDNMKEFIISPPSFLCPINATMHSLNCMKGVYEKGRVQRQENEIREDSGEKRRV